MKGSIVLIFSIQSAMIIALSGYNVHSTNLKKLDILSSIPYNEKI